MYIFFNSFPGGRCLTKRGGIGGIGSQQGWSPTAYLSTYTTRYTTMQLCSYAALVIKEGMPLFSTKEKSLSETKVNYLGMLRKFLYK